MRAQRPHTRKHSLYKTNNKMKKILFQILLFFSLFATNSSAQTSLNQRILFEPDSITIRESQFSQLQLIAEYVNNHPSATLIVAGFVSSLTPKAHHDLVAQQRADAVRQKLITTYGLPADRVIAIGVGEGTRYDQPEFNEVVSFYVK